MQMPCLVPAELWRQTGRWDSMGAELIRLADRKEEQFCLAPTHEEVVTHIVANDVASYRHLPLRLYQIGWKFRDEMRPRFGLMRGKEFLMKEADMYSFDANESAALESYNAVKAAYERIFTSLALPTSVAEADAGNIGGNRTEEFHVLTDVGEDVILKCSSCSYAANVEKAQGRLSEGGEVALSAEVSRRLQHFSKEPPSHPSSLLKLLLNQELGIKAFETEKKKIALVLVRADRSANASALKSEFAGGEPHHLPLEKLPPDALSNAIIFLDDSLPAEAVAGLMTALPASSFRRGVYRTAAGGDRCPCDSCVGTLKERRGIELGHVFYLGTKYSEKMGAHVHLADGKTVPVEMGCYGIGVTRVLAAIVETSHDKDGIIWPSSAAPYKVAVLSFANPGDSELLRAAEEVYDLVEATEGFLGEVVLDDRHESPGYKMKESTLIGYPWMIIVGRQLKAEGKVEIQERKTGRKVLLPKAELSAYLKESSKTL